MELWEKGDKRTCVKKLSSSHVGQIAWNKNKKLPSLSSIHKMKISEALSGVPKSEKHRLSVIKSRRYLVGVPCKESTRKKISESLTGKKASFDTRRKMSLSAKKGKENHAWRGGVTPENRRVRLSSEYQVWGLKVLQRDNFTCVLCDTRGGVLHADHIKQFAFYHALRFDVNNGRILCVKCHRQTDTWGVNIKII